MGTEKKGVSSHSPAMLQKSIAGECNEVLFFFFLILLPTIWNVARQTSLLFLPVI